MADASLDEICRYLASETKMSFVTQGDLDGRGITLVLEDKPVDVVVDLIARRIGTEWKVENDIFYIGSRSSADDSTLVRRVFGQSQQELEGIIVATDVAKHRVLPDGLVIASGDPRQIERLGRIFDEVEASQPNLWAIQIFILSMSKSDAIKLGLDSTPALDAAITFATGSGAGLDVSASFKSLLEAEDDFNSVNTVVKPVFLMLDGERSVFDRVTKFPVQTSVVSETGVVNRGQVAYQEAGTKIEVNIREMSADSIKLDLDLELSQPTVVNAEGFPTFETRRYSNPCVCVHGGVYLLTSIDLNNRSDATSTALRLGKRYQDSREVLQVFARVNRVKRYQFYKESKE